MVLREATGSQALVGWQGADGSSPWDVNDTEGNGTYVQGTLHIYISRELLARERLA